MKTYEIFCNTLTRMGIEYEETEHEIKFKYCRYNLKTLKYDDEIFLNISMCYVGELEFNPRFVKPDTLYHRILEVCNVVNMSYNGIKVLVNNFCKVDDRKVRFEILSIMEFIPFSVNLEKISVGLFFSLQDFMRLLRDSDFELKS